MTPKVDTGDLLDTQGVAEILGLAHRNTVTQSTAVQRYAETRLRPRPGPREALAAPRNRTLGHNPGELADAHVLGVASVVDQRSQERSEAPAAIGEPYQRWDLLFERSTAGRENRFRSRSGLRDAPPRAEDRRLTPATICCSSFRNSAQRLPVSAGSPGCEKRTTRRSPAVTTTPPTPPLRRGKPAAPRPTKPAARRLTSASRRFACASSGRCIRPPSAPRQLSAWRCDRSRLPPRALHRAAKQSPDIGMREHESARAG